MGKYTREVESVLWLAVPNKNNSLSGSHESGLDAHIKLVWIYKCTGYTAENSYLIIVCTV